MNFRDVEELEDDIRELEQENTKLLSERVELIRDKHSLKAKIYNIEDGLKRLDVVLNDRGYMISGDSHGGKSLYKINDDWELRAIQAAPTIADLIDAILTGDE